MAVPGGPEQRDVVDGVERSLGSSVSRPPGPGSRCGGNSCGTLGRSPTP